jgi:cation:H+ antiporter
VIGDALLVFLGIAVLLVGGDLLARGAVGIAGAAGVPPLLVGLTVVAFGTSAPELVVAVQAVVENAAGIALGNIVGSNIANALLAIGLPALIWPLSTRAPGVHRHALAMLGAASFFITIAYATGRIDRISGAALAIGLLVYIGYLALLVRRPSAPDPVFNEIAAHVRSAGDVGPSMMFLICGLVGLPVGAHFVVENGASLASSLGVRQDLIGVTIVALGTSLPELATISAAAVRKECDLAIGNVIGSNIFNLLAVGGAAGLAGGGAFSRGALMIDLPAMAVALLALCGFIFLKRDIGRVTGAFLVLAYVAFVALALSMRTP